MSGADCVALAHCPTCWVVFLVSDHHVCHIPGVFKTAGARSTLGSAWSEDAFNVVIIWASSGPSFF